MKLRTLLKCFIVLMAVAVGGLVYVIRQHTGASGRRALAARINVSEITNLKVKTVDDPIEHGYAYDINEYRAIPSLAGEKLNTMQGDQLPAFEFKGFTFVILHKWVNSSSGVGTGVRPPIEYSPAFRFEWVRENLWIWTLDLESRSPSR
jgi:hypothetical protein